VIKHIHALSCACDGVLRCVAVCCRVLQCVSVCAQPFSLVCALSLRAKERARERRARAFASFERTHGALFRALSRVRSLVFSLPFSLFEFSCTRHRERKGER